MPNAKVLSEKQAIVAALTEQLQNAASGVLVDYKGITVAEDTALRAELRKNDVEYAVVKNTMLRFALEGTGLEGLASVLEGTTALALAHEEDPMAAARILQKIADKPNTTFAVKAGFLEGQVMNAAEVAAIAQLPGREGMLSMFAGALTSTLSGLAVAMQAYVDKMSNPEEEPAA